MPIRAYARSRGVSHVAVLKAAKAGRIPLEPDGSIDPAKADAAWDRSTDPSKAKGTAKPAPKSTKPPPDAMKPVAEAAVGSVRETLKEQGLPASGSVTFVQARTAYQIAREQPARLSHRQIKLWKLRNALVGGAQPELCPLNEQHAAVADGEGQIGGGPGEAGSVESIDVPAAREAGRNACAGADEDEGDQRDLEPARLEGPTGMAAG